MRSAAAAIALLLGSAQVLAAQGLGSITGTVRDTSGVPVPGAEVILDNRRLLTTPQGGFRFDSLPVGTRIITIRLVGYTALRLPVTVRSQLSHYNYVLRRAPYVLPTVTAEARRAGIYGTVGDTSLTPLAGVKVQLAGRGGGEAATASSGRFAFPAAAGGQYLVRTAHPGYAEQRMLVELKQGEGVELAIRLRPSRVILSRADEVAVHDLGRRLVLNLSGDRFSASQLTPFGSLGLCEVKGIAARLRASTDALTIILNGTVVLENMSVRDLCSWQADEVELVEYGDTVCRDVTRTLVDMLNVWCTRFTRSPNARLDDPRLQPRFGRPGGGIRTQRPPGPFVVIWERR